MAIRVKHKVWVNTARDTGMTDLVYGPAETARITQTDTFDQWGGGSFDIPVSDNEDLDLGDVASVKGIYLEVGADVQIKLNGSSDLIQLRRANSIAGQVARFFIEADISQVNVVNPSATEAASGHFHIWGSST